MSTVSFDSQVLKEKNVIELHEIAKVLNIPKFRKLKKQELIDEIVTLKSATPKAPITKKTITKEEKPSKTEIKVTKVVEKQQVEAKPAAVKEERKTKPSHKASPSNEQRKSSNSNQSYESKRNNNSDQRRNNSSNSYDQRRNNNSDSRKNNNQNNKKYQRPERQDRNSSKTNYYNSGYPYSSDRIIYVQGILEVLPEGYGFLRVKGYLPSTDDVYISQTQIRRFGLATGHIITGQVRPPKEGEKYYSMLRLELINGNTVETTKRRRFDDLVPIYPQERLSLENDKNPENTSVRIIDIFSPIGKGQRGLLVSPPKAGKTTLLKGIANSISENNPEVYLIALLIDERPEEVTDFERSINGEVVSSTFDELPDTHARISELVLEKSKRLVEHGYDVVILLDSITRMGRAYNLIIPPSGRTLSGGLDPNAMHRPKRFFGAARNIEKGGSLTILATALVETGSRMDDVIFEEFKGTGNMELRLDRKLSDRRIYPAIDIKQSGTRKEELLLENDVLRKQLILRRTLDSGDTAEVADFIISRLKKSNDNKEFLASIVDN